MAIRYEIMRIVGLNDFSSRYKFDVIPFQGHCQYIREQPAVAAIFDQDHDGPLTEGACPVGKINQNGPQYKGDFWCPRKTRIGMQRSRAIAQHTLAPSATDQASAQHNAVISNVCGHYFRCVESIQCGELPRNARHFFRSASAERGSSGDWIDTQCGTRRPSELIVTRG